MLDHGDGTGQPGLVEQVLRGHLASDLTRDDILDNITLYWLTNLIHYNRLDRGGHFAAWEQPDLFAAEMRASFRSLR
jgi:pimeloyl-ACP methyl ester carboxylesterase